MTLILAQQDRGLTRDIVIQNSAGATITPGANDQVRARILRLGQVPKLTVTGTANGNGSVFTKNSPSSGTNRLRIDATDLAAIDPGTYTLMIDYFDRADTSEWKTVDRQVFHVEASEGS